MASTTVVTPIGRTSFMKVYEPQQSMNGEMEYSLRLLVPKDDKDMKRLKDAWERVCLEEFRTPDPPGCRPFLSASDPYDDKGWIMDGDWKYNNTPDEKKDMYAAYQGHWVVSAKAKADYPPKVVDENKEEILDRSTFQSGDYARCVLELSAFTNKKLRRPVVSVKLLVVQKTGDGERFGGGVSPERAMAALDDLPGAADDIL